MKRRTFPATRLVLGLAAAVSIVLLARAHTLASGGIFAEPTQPTDGTTTHCDDFRLLLNLGFFSLDVGGLYDPTDEGWVWIEPEGRHFRSISGVAVSSGVTNKDTPANHDSHDHTNDVRVDVGQEDRLSIVNEDEADDPRSPDTIELEWEIGTRPSEKSGDGVNPFFPRWAWPSVGDRVWADGNWVYDCGHSTDVGGIKRYRAELHPPRASAAMRNQAGLLPGSGTARVPTTATDLYIHGRGGFITTMLNCGMSIILGDHPDNCGQDPPPADTSYRTTPIDTNFEFDVCLPPRPSSLALLSVGATKTGLGDTAPDVAPEYTKVAAGDACKAGSDFDQNWMLHVKVDLTGSGIAPDRVYARHIDAGWVFPPEAPLRHFTLTVNQMDLHSDKEFFGDGEMTFFWMNVDRSPTPWYRLVDFQIPTDDDAGLTCFDHTNTMNDYDDDDLCGNGLLNFSGPTFDYYVRDGQPVTVRTVGYEQDCYDGFYGFHHLLISMYALPPPVGCLNIFDSGQNDTFAHLSVSRQDGDAPTFGPASSPAYGVGVQNRPARNVVPNPGGGDPLELSDYDLKFTIEEMPNPEDPVDLRVTKSCTHAGEVAVSGQPFTCTIGVENAGPGLPRNVVLQDTLTTDLAAGQYTTSTPTFTLGNSFDSVSGTCVAGPADHFTCDLGTVPAGTHATIVMSVTPNLGGTFTNTARVTAATSDSDAANDEAQAVVTVFQEVPLDLGGDTVSIKKHGVVSVGILTIPELDAATIDPSTVCFGDAGQPAERDCTEAHGRGHLEDLNRDRVIDLLVHFEVAETGIDPGDTTACLTGVTFGGKHVYGCGAIRVVP